VRRRRRSKEPKDCEGDQVRRHPASTDVSLPLAMKRFFSNLKVQKSSSSNNVTKSTSPTPSVTTVHTPSLKPEFKIPPMPHPCPYDHLALLVTPAGLLIRPQSPGITPATHVRLTWGKHVKVEEMQGSGDAEDADWANSVVVYGIIGMMELFDGTYMLSATFKPC
jgi:hypothetical protein